MHQKNSVVSIGLCMIGFVIFGLFFSLRSSLGYFIFPLLPGIFVFIIIIIIAAVSIENSKNRNKSYYRNNYNCQSSWKNPYVVQNSNIKPIEVKEDSDIDIQAQYCQYCGVKIDREANYCHNCGSSLSES
ncbi:MAG: zinc-ribbon domain-containing protein [Candidatus Heimdallarchaeota archaeon]